MVDTFLLPDPDQITKERFIGKVVKFEQIKASDAPLELTNPSEHVLWLEVENLSRIMTFNYSCIYNLPDPAKGFSKTNKLIATLLAPLKKLGITAKEPKELVGTVLWWERHDVELSPNFIAKNAMEPVAIPTPEEVQEAEARLQAVVAAIGQKPPVKLAAVKGPSSSKTTVVSPLVDSPSDEDLMNFIAGAAPDLVTTELKDQVRDSFGAFERFDNRVVNLAMRLRLKGVLDFKGGKYAKGPKYAE